VQDFQVLPLILLAVVTAARERRGASQGHQGDPSPRSHSPSYPRTPRPVTVSLYPWRQAIGGSPPPRRPPLVDDQDRFSATAKLGDPRCFVLDVLAAERAQRLDLDLGLLAARLGPP
jgi:hypothetical protein